ncbi:hypothetical protein TB2_006224 [Malus domestica]
MITQHLEAWDALVVGACGEDIVAAVSTRGSHCRLALIEQVEWWILGHGELLMRFFFCGLRHLKLYSVMLHACGEKTVVRFACKTTKLCALCTRAASGRRGVYESKHFISTMDCYCQLNVSGSSLCLFEVK